MHDFSVKMTKIVIIIIATSAMVIMISGMNLLKNNYYWRSEYFIMQIDYIGAKLAFFEYNNGGIINWIRNTNDGKKNKENIYKNNAQSIPILLYHGIIKDPDWKQDDVNIRFSVFRDQMFALKKAGYQTITVEDYIAFKRGEKILPQKSFMLTFDDGREDSYYPADPILKTVGFKAVMHIITGRSLNSENQKGEFHLSGRELKKMIESGRWEIESHGKNDHDYIVIDSEGNVGNFLSNKLWIKEKNRIETNDEYKKRISGDLWESKTDLEKKLGINVRAFAYPFGNYGQNTKNFPEGTELLKSTVESIYPVSFSQAGSSEFPTNYVKETSVFAKRISVDSSISARELIRTLKNTAEKPTNYTDNFIQNNGWLPGWGLISVKNNSMTIGANESEDSALTFLGGSYLWKNYFLQADVRIANGNAFTLAGRYIDGNNYVACDYYDNRVVLSQKVNKEDKPEIESILDTFTSVGKEMRVGISVDGNIASCYLNDGKIISGQIHDSINHGGVSFKIWNTMRQDAHLIVRNLKVSEKI